MDKWSQRLAKNQTDLMPKNASCKRWDTPQFMVVHSMSGFFSKTSYEHCCFSMGCGAASASEHYLYNSSCSLQRFPVAS